MMTGDTGLDGSTLFTGSVRLPVAPRNSTVTAFGTTLRMDQTTLTIPDTDATDDHELHAQLSRSGTLAQDFDQTLSHVPVVPGAVDGTAPIAQRSAMGGSGAPTPYHQQLEWRQGIAASVPGSSHPSNTGSRTQGGHSPLSTSTAESRGGATSVTATSQAPASQGPRSGVGGGELVVAGGDQGYRSVGAASSVAANPFRETESRSERGTAAPRNDASAATNPFAFVVSELTSQAEQSLRDLRSRGMGQTLTHPPTSAPPQQPNPYRSAPAPAASALGSKSSRPALSAAAMTNAASAPPGVADVGTPTKTQSQSQSRVMINDKPGGGGGADRADASMRSCISQREWTGDANHSARSMGRSGSPGPSDDMGRSMRSRVSFSQELERPASNPALNQSRGRSPSKLRGGDGNDAGPDEYKSLGGGGSVAPNPFTDVESRADPSSRVESHRSTASAREGGGASPSRVQSQPPSVAAPGSSAAAGAHPSTNQPLSQAPSQLNMTHGSFAPTESQQEMSTLSHMDSRRSSNPAHNHPSHNASPSRPQSHRSAASSAAPNPFTEVESRADLSMSRAESHRSAVSNRDRSPSKVQSQQSMAGPASSVVPNPFTEVESRADLSMSRMESQRSAASTANRSPSRTQSQRSAGPASSVVPNPFTEVESRADLSVSHRSTVSNRDRSPSKVRSQQSQANQSVRSVAGPASSVAANPFTEVESRADLSMSRVESQRSAVSPSRRASQAQSQANESMRSAYDDVFLSKSQHERIPSQGLSQVSAPTSAPPAVHQEKSTSEMFYNDHTEPPREEEPESMRSLVDQCSLDTAAFQATVGLTETYNFGDADGDANPGWQSTTMDLAPPQQSHRSGVPHDPQSTAVRSVAASAAPYTHDSCGAGASHPGNFDGSGMGSERVFSHTHHSEAPSQSHGHRSMGPASSVVPNPFTEVESRADLSVSHRSTVSNRDRSPSKVRSQQSQANQSVRSVAGPASSVAANPFTEVESRADLSMSRMSRVGSQASRRGDEGATLRPMDMPQPESTGPPLPSAHMSQSQPPHEQHYGRDQRRRSSASCMHAEGSFGTNNSAYQMGAGAPASHVSQGHLQQHASQSHHSQATAGRTASAASGSMARMPSAVGPVSEGSQVPARLQASQRSMASRHSVGAQMPSRVSVGAQVPSEHASRAGAALPQQGVEQLPAGDDAARGEEAFVRNAHALRSVKRMSHDDFDRLRSYVNCPHPFAHYCLALGALLAGRSPIPFRNPLSLAGYWRGVQGLLASPTILFRLLSACDPWETTPQAQEFLASLEGQPLPDAGLRLVSPCAYALAEWVVTFGQKWRELGAPVMVDGEVQREERPPTPPSRRRGVVSVQTLMQRARNRSLTPTGRGRWGERSAGSRRDTSPGSSTPRGGSRSARQSPSSRAAAAARGPHPVWNFGTAGGNANPIENFGWQPRSPRGSPHRTLATDPATLEDRLLHALVDVRTLTPWDLSHLSNHTLQRNPLSAVVKACVKATAAMIGLAGPAPDDDTVDLFAVGTSALRSQPEEVLTAMRKLEASSVPMDVLEYVSQLLPETVNPSTPTPYLAVNVMRTWCAVMVEYQRAKAGGHVDFPDLPVKADAALASLGFASPARSPARQGAAGTAETSTNAALFSPARQTHGEGRASPERGSPRAAPPASPSRDGLRSPQRTRGSGRADLQLHAWLEDAGLGKYAEVFVEHEVDMDSLVLLNEADLNAMGLAIGPRRKIMAFIEARRGQQHQQ